MKLSPSKTAVLVLLAFPAGMMFANLFPGLGYWMAIPILIALGLFLFSYPKSIRKERALIFICGFSLIGAGYTRVEIQRRKKEFLVSVLAEKQLHFAGTMTENPVPTKKGNRSIVEITEIRQDGQVFPVETKAWMYFDDKEFCPVKYEKLEFTSKVHAVQTDSGSFGKYLESQAIFFQGKAWGFHSLGIEKGSFSWMDDLRRNILSKMKTAIADPAIAGLSSAMMIGDKSGLQKQTRSEFSGAGLSHVLAVSGMHIALLFEVVWALLLPFTKTKRSRKIATVFAMFILAGFGMLAGGGGSVLRALFMFEAVLITRLLGSGQNGMQGLLTAIFFLLLIDPALLKDPGFQLSCAAVWGILWLGPKIQRWFDENIPFLPGDLRSSLSITLAAQASTSLIVIWHFETFPAWFIPANLIVVPLSNYVMKFGFAAVALCWIPYLGVLLLKILGWGVFVLAWLAKGFSTLPGAKISSFSTEEKGIWILAAWVVLFLGLALWARFWKEFEWELIKGYWNGKWKVVWGKR